MTVVDDAATTRPDSPVDPGLFRFRALTEPDARQISTWRYPPPYDFYDVPEDAWLELLGLGAAFIAVDLAPGAMLPPVAPGRSRLTRLIPRIPRLRPRSSGAPVAAGGSGQRVAGFVCFGHEAQVAGARDAGLYAGEALDIGIGLRPDLTGRGLGAAFFAACVAHARVAHDPPALRLSVAAFNERAIATYRRAGFTETGRCLSPVRGRPRPFIVMTSR